jgi:hypothetical protein
MMDMLYRTLPCLALILSGCAAKPPAPAAGLPSPPPGLQSCPAGAARPKPPPAPRTVAQLAAWAVQEDHAREATENARRECARRLDRLQQWIAEHAR